MPFVLRMAKELRQKLTEGQRAMMMWHSDLDAVPNLFAA